MQILIVVWIILLILVNIQANIIFHNNEKLIIINWLYYPNTPDNSSGGMTKDHGSGTVNEGIGTITDFDVNNTYEHYNNDGCICNAEKQCVCTNFKDAFNLVENNTVIAINGTLGDKIIFDVGITINNITNISIIGYYKVVKVDCLAKGFIEFKHCNNIIIENITWIQCGNNEDYRGVKGVVGRTNYAHNFHDDFFQIYSNGLNFVFCTNIAIKSCTFEASMVGINGPSGVVYIDQVHFLSTSAHDPPGVSLRLSLATGLIINQANVNADNSILVKITNSLFSQAECLNACKYLLLFYILVDDPHSTLQVFVNQTNFSSASYDPGWAAENGMVWIRILSSRDAYIEFNGVKFLYNDFQPEKFPSQHQFLSFNFAAIFYIFSNTSGTRVNLRSSTFLNNKANTVVLFKGDMYIDITDTNFCNNKVDSIISVEFSSHSNTICTTIKFLQSVFSNNTGGQLISLTAAGQCILVNISGLTIISNYFLSRNGGLIIFKDYYVLIASITNVKYESNYINAEGSGFHFTSAMMSDNDNQAFLHRRAVFYEPPICIPQEFHTVPQQYRNVYGQANCLYKNYHWLSFTNSSFRNNIGGGHGAVIYINLANNFIGTSNSEISRLTLNNNKDYKSLIHTSSRGFVNATLFVKDSVFTQNDETLFHIVNHILQFSNENRMTVFDRNRGQNGAVLYLDMNTNIIFTNTAMVLFNNNIARRYGGVIFYNVSQLSNACYKNVSTFIIDNNASVKFNNNQARSAGDSIFLSISQSCNATSQYENQSAVFGQSTGKVVMPPNRLKLYYPAQLINSTDLDIDTYYISNIMLGQNIIIPACTVDHNEMPLWSTQFTLQVFGNNEQNYSIQGSEVISVECRTLKGINNLIITGKPPLSDINSTLLLQVNSFYDSVFDWKLITVNLNVQLSSCHLGFYYSSYVEHCVCYTTDDIVTCSGSNSTIRNGYWFGTINDQPTVTVCPINYCNFDNCEATTGTCDLHPLRDNQCRAHRSGAVCGNCEEGYTLSFDSIECIDIDSCTVGQTVLVISMSFLYWITIVVVVFGMMYFKIEIGYLYGIIFYYSIADVLLGETLQFHDGLHQFVTIFSSAANLLPQFLGRLCLVEGMSGIDQQFIHYLHPLAVLVIILLLSISTRFSPRLSLFISRAVIHAICLLLLLSYTSIASTTLLLVRSIRFTNIDKVYSYLSPDIEYFHGRHLIYVLVAILTGLVIVIGLPLLLSLEPLINSKINFIKIKPLLDQFQGCYKDRFRYFASYYMILRLIVLTILVINATNIFITLYLILISCSLMMFIHTAVRPYSNYTLNLFDSFVLLMVIFIITLRIIEAYRGFPTSTTMGIAFALFIFPVIVFFGMIAYLQWEHINKFVAYCISVFKPAAKTTDSPSNEGNEMTERGIIVDDQLRAKSTTVV